MQNSNGKKHKELKNLNGDKKREKNKVANENKANMIISSMEVDTNDNKEITNRIEKIKIDPNKEKNNSKLESIKSKQELDGYYLENENQTLINNYGPDIYEYSKSLESNSLLVGFMRRHKIDATIRTKMIDWMIEVLYAFHSDSPTLFLAVDILDTYIAKSATILTNNDIHITGIVCIFIASKMEDIVPLRMSYIKSKIGHNKFTEKEIKAKEKIILQTINYDIISTSTYDFIKTFLFDLCHNNRDSIKAFQMTQIIEIFDNICIFLAKIMMHNEEFSSYQYSLRAIVCIVVAFDMLRSNCKQVSKECEGFLRQWVSFLLNLDFIFN